MRHPFDGIAQAAEGTTRSEVMASAASQTPWGRKAERLGHGPIDSRRRGRRARDARARASACRRDRRRAFRQPLVSDADSIGLANAGRRRDAPTPRRPADRLRSDHQRLLAGVLRSWRAAAAWSWSGRASISSVRRTAASSSSRRIPARCSWGSRSGPACPSWRAWGSCWPKARAPAGPSLAAMPPPTFNGGLLAVPPGSCSRAGCAPNTPGD